MLRSLNSLAQLGLLPLCSLSLALTSRWIPDSFCYVRPRRHSEYGIQSGSHRCDLCRPTPVHFGIDGVLPAVYGLALRKVRGSSFESPLKRSELVFCIG